MRSSHTSSDTASSPDPDTSSTTTHHDALPTHSFPQPTDDEPPRPSHPRLTQGELLSFVDPPPFGDTVDEHLKFINDPFLRGYAPPDEPDVLVAHERDDAEFPTWEDLDKTDEATQKAVYELNYAIWRRLHNPEKMSAAKIYDKYRRIPGTRMSVIPFSVRHRLLQALGTVEKKDSKSMLRYFAIIADVKDSGFSLWRAEWNAAISFASRYVGSSKMSETDAALSMWREMEQDAGIKGNGVTFNILFDVASKSGNFTLAEMVYKEMSKRHLRFNRYHRVSLIHFFGLKMDSDGVRVAYYEMVRAGEMIDDVVLNCVIAGFLRCGEEDAAERVYNRMRQSHKKALDQKRRERAVRATEAAGWSDPSSPHPHTEREQSSALPAVLPDSEEPHAYPSYEDDELTTSFENPNFTTQKKMTNILMMLAKVTRKNKKLRSGFQHLVPTGPNFSTYRIFINHYAVRVGNLPQVTRYLSDMRSLHIPLQGAIFLALFKGFALYGGRPGTASMWSEQRLRSIWAALLKALDEDDSSLYISTWLLIWVLRAFHRCSTPEMVFKAYNSLTLRWDPSEADADFSIGFLHDLLRNEKTQYTDKDRNNDDDGENRYWEGGPSVIGSLGSRSFG